MKHSDSEQGLRAYEALLAGPGIERGLIGPRERDRLWDRHILNCAVVADSTDLLPRDSHVVDVGTGAGLPGIVWAIVRPDLRISLIESLLRRTTFLDATVAELGLADRVDVVRARAEEATVVDADVVTARAVAPMPKLLTWLRPLVRSGGQLVLLKGKSAAEEIETAADLARTLGLARAELMRVGEGVVDPATTVVRYRVH